ncbi:hypothetical protein BKA70DRAFT_752203 [Coprinopsis sp. MPI-PUGE-AT-0042]|nr:hypothetical protein BKA70DRAFT_752203 [Coprinopsis sp. MPI-PUGE-AT-0042]
MWSFLLGSSASYDAPKILPPHPEDIEELDNVLKQFREWFQLDMWSRLLGILRHPKLSACQCKYRHRPSEVAKGIIRGLVFFKTRLGFDMQYLPAGCREAWATVIEDIDKYCEALWEFRRRPYRQGTHCRRCQQHVLSEEYQRARKQILDASSYIEYDELANLTLLPKEPKLGSRRRNVRMLPIGMPSVPEDRADYRPRRA